MDKLHEFIESLRDITTENVRNYCMKFRELVENTEIYGAKKTFSKYDCSIRIDNICIKSYKQISLHTLQIIINNKYLFIGTRIICRIIEDPLDNITHYINDYKNYECLYIDISCMNKVPGVGVDWLFIQKNIKSARN